MNDTQTAKAFHFCKVADISDWDDPAFQATEALLMLYGKNRKAWEFIQVYNGLKQLGLLNGESRGLGLGVGHECLIYAFTNVCQEIIATDLYNSPNWSTAAMSTDEVYDKNLFPYRRDRLTVRHMDMTTIEYPDASFDFIWSCCSIEHVSTFEALHHVYSEIHRVLKPGGIAALTTEFNPTDRHSYEPHMLFTDRYWIDHWLKGENPVVKGFELLDEIDFSLTSAAENGPIPRKEKGTHIQVISKDIILNSVAFFLRKSGEFSQPYHDAWLSEPWRIYVAAFTELKKNNIDASQQLFSQLLATESLDPRLKIAASRYRAAFLIEQQKLDEAKAICERAIPFLNEIEGGDHLLPLARSFKIVKLFEAAKSIHEKVENAPGSQIDQVIRSILYQAEYFDRKGDFSQALAIAQRAYQTMLTTATKEEHKVYFHLGLYNEKLSRYETAMAHYNQAIAAAPVNPPFHKNCTLRINECLKQQQQSKTIRAKLRWFLKPIKTYIKSKRSSELRKLRITEDWLR